VRSVVPDLDLNETSAEGPEMPQLPRELRKARPERDILTGRWPSLLIDTGPRPASASIPTAAPNAPPPSSSNPLGFQPSTSGFRRFKEHVRA
jgi:hypothetical protein